MDRTQDIIIVMFYATHIGKIVASERDFKAILPDAVKWFKNNVVANANACNLHLLLRIPISK